MSDRFVALVLGVLLAGCGTAAPTTGEYSCSRPGAPPQGAVELSEEESEARLRDGGMPRVEYPVSARRARVQGEVIVAFAVGIDGGVLCADVERGVDRRLDAAALDAVLGARYQPLVVDGSTVPFMSRATVAFRMR